MILTIHPDNPDVRKIDKVIEILNKGGLAIIPTDTVYAFVCTINNKKGIEKIAWIKGFKPEKAMFSLMLNDFSQVSECAKNVSTPVFKMLKKNLPGTFTFIMSASNNLPTFFKKERKTIGIRIPRNYIISALVSSLNAPLVCSSVKNDDEDVEYTINPYFIHDKYENIVDVVVDGGIGGNVASTIVDMTSTEPIILREGVNKLLI